MAKKQGNDTDLDWRRNRGSENAEPSRPLTPEEIAEHAQSVMSGKGLSDALKVRTGKDGKASWFIFNNLSPDVAGLLGYGYDIVRPKINDFGAGFLYNRAGDTVSFFKKNATEATKHKAGLRAAKGFMAAMIIADPVQKLWHARTEYKKGRDALFDAIRPVIESNSNYKQNEVIGTALKQLGDQASLGMKTVISDLPVLGLTVYYAGKDFSALKAEKEKVFQHKQKLVSPAKNHSDYDKLYDEHEKKVEASTANFIKQWEAAGFSEKAIEDKVLRYQKSVWEKFELEQQQLHDVHSEADKHKNKGSDSTAWMTGAGALSYLLQTKIGRGKDTPDAAIDMILQLTQDVENNNSVPDLRGRITEIFQQNERDYKRQVVGDRLMPQLSPAIERIAEVIEDGRLNPLALINLVGEGKIIKNKGGRREFVSAKEVDGLIAEQLKVLSSRELINKEEFFGNYTNPKLVEETLKQTMHELPAEQRNVVAAMFPTDIVEQMGFSRHEVIQMQKQGHDRLYAVVAARTLELASMNGAEREKLGLTPKENQALDSLAQSLVEQGNLEPVKVVVDGREKDTLNAVRTAALHQQTTTTEGNGVWTKMIQKASGVQEMIARKSREFADNEMKQEKARRLAESAREREEARRSSGEPEANVRG